VAKIEDDIPNFDEMISPDEMSMPDEAATPAEVATPAEAVASEEVATPAEEPAPVEPKKKAKRRKASYDEATPGKRTTYLTIGVAVGVPALLIVLAFAGLLSFAAAVYLIGLAFVAIVTWLGRETNTVYTIFLGVVLIALMTSVFLLWVRLADYHYDVKAQEAKQRVAATQPLDRNGVESERFVER
jgi:hypothetical protein